MFERVLIANRGAIACRITRTLHRLGVEAVAVYSEADRHSRHVLDADHAVAIGGAAPAESYLCSERIIAACRETGAQAVHPGYGFLSESVAFAAACEAAGIAFLGPTPEQIAAFGGKDSARRLAAANGVSLLPGSDLLADVDAALAAAADIGYPVILKADAGGGGIGMRVCADAEALRAAYRSVTRLAQDNFASGAVFLERYVATARHVEVQIFGDGAGGVVAFPERDCSLQRRNQKVIEETPAPDLPAAVRTALREEARRLAAACHYRSAGTVEFLYDVERAEHAFLEVNTRLQVEHGVTEAVCGVDLVEWMLRLGCGELTLPERDPSPRGHAIQARIYAEDPGRDFQPATGVLHAADFPDDLRVDTWVAAGTEITPWYDPMLAKVIAHADDRSAAIAALRTGLSASELAGVTSNRRYLISVLDGEAFRTGAVSTATLAAHRWSDRSVEVVSGGAFTTIQDHPGRVGYWHIGVPPSGPFDALSLRLANHLVGNRAEAPALECTALGPTLRFREAAVIALVGADMGARLDDAELPMGCAVTVPAGATLRLGRVAAAGTRCYLAVRDGFAAPAYLESRSTFTLGGFGGHAGRCLASGDVLPLGDFADPEAAPITATLAPAQLPPLSKHWQIGVLSGPHGAPDFFTAEDIATFFATDWEVHYHSSRTGVRLIGPKPQWARPDGGEAGLHPSNIHDNAYAIGAIDFTGDMPVILGPDGPSLGGFVCPATVVRAELWKLGQLAAGDRVRFVPVTHEWAAAAIAHQDRAVTGRVDAAVIPLPSAEPVAEPVISAEAGDAQLPEICYRRAGDDYLLVEFGPNVLDLELRFRVHALMQAIDAHPLPGMLERTPGVRSLQIHYDSTRLPLARLLAHCQQLERDLPRADEVRVPSRKVHLPLSWDDPATREAIERYQRSVRPDAPWCPSNIEFIRRINGLADEAAVKDIVFDAEYLVMGLGDVYLGAPLATPLDPCHRLVTTKYNPARTWTPENAVGIGGAYLCIYGMEGPGGYQFVGRTLQVWNRFTHSTYFPPGKPWLLRFFDRLVWHEVDADELLRQREAFAHGRHDIEIVDEEFDLGALQRDHRERQSEIAAFKAQQQAAFDAERERWRAAGQDLASAIEPPTPEVDDSAVPAGCLAIESPLAGSLCQVAVSVGQRVAADDLVVVVEAMKTENGLSAGVAGTVRELRCEPGAAVRPGQVLVVIEPETGGAA